MEDYIKYIWDYCIGSDKEIGLDAFGNEIKLNEYGMKSKYGWTIDHIWPLAPNGIDYKTGSYSLQNLQVLAFKANTKKANNVSGKINDIDWSIKKVGEDKDGNNIGRMKVKIDGQWYWAYNDWKL